MALIETRDHHKRQGVAVKEVLIRGLNKELEEMKETQIRMEDKIYGLSIQNKQRQDDKEVMVMLLPQIYKAIQGRPNNLRGYLSQLENEALKSKVQKILQTYKVPGLK
jgi:hypothetical protein